MLQTTRRFLAVLHARNLEFLRDRASMAWNIVVPVFLVLALSVLFGGSREEFKVAVLSPSGAVDTAAHPFLSTRYVDFYPVGRLEEAVRKVGRHRIDMLVDPAGARYWVNEDSAKGYVLERMLTASGGARLERQSVTGAEVRYVDFVLPGILGMNMMFSGLFGVGYVLVRYRKNGFLKRLNATPLRAVEFLCAQIASRMLLMLTISSLVFTGIGRMIDFRMEGSYLDLFLVALLGAAAMVSLGLVVAARVNSEELASGLLNVISWPMVMLSGVWFSLEGSQPWVQSLAQVFPLTHLLEAARAIMLDGAGLSEVAPHLLTLAGMSLVFVSVGAVVFRWSQD